MTWMQFNKTFSVSLQMKVSVKLQEYDIHTEYHPSSGLKPQLDALEDYRCYVNKSSTQKTNEKPWAPFHTEADFKFAEFVLDASLNHRQIDSLLKLMHTCIDKKDELTIQSNVELQKLWEMADTSGMLTPFIHHTVAVPYKQEEQKFDFWCRPLWNWLSDLISDVDLAPHFVWDAQQLFVYQDSSFIRFFDEPWTANHFWEVQSKLPSNGKPLGLILYADKTKLSSFGTAMGYPIVAHCANLPAHLCNGEGIGGGRVVGWLPIVKETEDEKSKPGFVDFKRAVWHESFRKLLETIKLFSKTGCSILCGDGIICLLFPFVIILSADYEEQCVMANICGLGGLAPCPVCLVPRNELLSPVHTVHPLRTQEDTSVTILTALQSTSGVREEILKKKGLRPITASTSHNAFWEIAHSDPHATISWDWLHSHSAGLGGKHLWPELQEYLKHEPFQRSDRQKVDDQMKSLPRWRDLNHFDKVFDMHFADATKWEDITKLAPYVLHNILEKSVTPHGYLLLCCLQSYIKLDIYASLDLHTEKTLAAGKNALKDFINLIIQYAEATKDVLPGDWHRDVASQVCLSIYNCDVTLLLNKCIQILKIDHHLFIAKYIRNNINQLHEETESTTDHREPIIKIIGNIYLGSKQKECSLDMLELSKKSSDQGYIRFRIKLAKFLNEYLPAISTGHPPVKLKKDALVTEYRFLKVNFTSIVTWQLLYIFTIEIENTIHPLALVLPLDAAIGALTQKEKDLGFLRLCAQPQINAEFFSLHSIKRGVCLAPGFERDGDFFVIDVIDTDMFLRVEKILRKHDIATD
ncbi:hypothetical protein BDQ12DRAFT_773340 [Crucibulum laeve]|uniref:Uncharacterized protein n=1 Tax=Crucibulum laeve TaxID=68775 RepID=A0A5C3LKP6_9AGAR|nr:hypothetical protein BDQ12DRAFT_773340 [Crucibulum laeve]